MVLPDLPLLLNQIGGKSHTWLIIPVFSIIALICRPFSGKLCDTIGRVNVMCIGAVVTTLACDFYIFIPIVGFFFFTRAFHGLCAGFTPTGFTAFADDVVPLSKRGEAMGIVGICNNVGNALGWVLGSECTNMFGIHTMFLIASMLGFISLLMFMTLKEHVIVKEKFSFSMLKIKKDEIFETRVWEPGIVMLLVVFSSGAVLALISDFTIHVGLKNKGIFMAIYIGSSLFIRFLAGRWSDRYGRKWVAGIGAFLLAISMFGLAATQGIWMYTISSVFFGVGFGLLSPSLFAWAVDLAEEGKKGKAIGTLFLYLEGGVILGASICGLLYNNNVANFQPAFIICGLLALAGTFFIVLTARLKILKSK